MEAFGHTFYPYMTAHDYAPQAFAYDYAPHTYHHDDYYLPDFTGVPDFAAGLVYGLTGHNHLDEIQHCFDGSTQLAAHAKAALDDIRHLNLIKGI